MSLLEQRSPHCKSWQKYLEWKRIGSEMFIKSTVVQFPTSYKLNYLVLGMFSLANGISVLEINIKFRLHLGQHEHGLGQHESRSGART